MECISGLDDYCARLAAPIADPNLLSGPVISVK